MIRYWNRERKTYALEKVYGEKLIRGVYDSFWGRALLALFLTRPWFSKLYGWFQSRPASSKKIAPFIADYDIPMDEFITPPGGYTSFNDFFIRAFRPGARPVTQDPRELAAPAEGRYFAFSEVHADETFKVKGQFVSPRLLLGNEWGETFAGGPMLIARLCPVDYHRFHFPESGTVLAHQKIHGVLHSVNPVALARSPRVFVQNERQITILQTENFGKLAYVEIGAICVGKIVQSFGGGSSALKGREIRRGDEKGYFLFGGSCVILVGEKGAWTPTAELLEQTTKGYETLVRLGSPVALR